MRGGEELDKTQGQRTSRHSGVSKSEGVREVEGASREGDSTAQSVKGALTPSLYRWEN